MSDKKAKSTRGRFATSDINKLKQSEMVNIEGRFYLTTVKEMHRHYNTYNGIDVQTSRWITVYVKVKSQKFALSSKIKQEIRNTLSPKLLWEGELLLNGGHYYAQIYQNGGPSFQQLFQKLRTPLSSKQLLHLLLQLLKLIQKLSNARYACGNLTPEFLHFDSNPKKNDIYLANCYNLKRKNEPRKPSHSRYCSTGTHLGRNLHIKDDLESIIYILLDIYLPQPFLEGCSPKQFQQKKTALKLQELSRSLPMAFAQFYCDVISLNLSSEFNFFHWKTYLAKILTPSITTQPYLWMAGKTEICSQDLILGLGNINKKGEDKLALPLLELDMPQQQTSCEIQQQKSEQNFHIKDIGERLLTKKTMKHG